MIMREISDVSDPSAVDVEVWERDTRKVLLGVWWGLWVTALVLRQIYNLIPAPGGAVDSGGYDIVGLLGWAAGFFATIAAFLVVRRIDADQQSLGARLLDARVGLEGSFPEAV